MLKVKRGLLLWLLVVVEKRGAAASLIEKFDSQQGFWRAAKKPAL